ncbi:sensor histidine kinase [Lysobacter sp. TY2-98]|uniref:sensor histidine kinase n=1 Tax=Lysobacter sp. TY2-98 TaxID=2290922 RepID=UPI000E208F67|nr:HAMP domain-containing sensor histidine kinase [Lysobacter sp. TY2-98]AXK70864.1 sensor histidine kinase [Lysobacter sp. TY2-98]
MIAWPRSTSARLAIAVTLSFFVAFVVLGVGVRFTVSTLLDGDTRDVVRADEAGLLEIARDDGRQDFIDEVRSRVESDDDAAVYGLFDTGGRRIAGPLAHVPGPRDPHGWVEFAQSDDSGQVRVIARVHRFRDGLTLVTGQRTRSQDRFLALMLRTALAAALVAATLGALTGWFASRWVSRRLRDLDQTAQRVGDGELGLRAPVDGSNDAFDRLARRFNAMLDRIEALLGAVRHATDHIAHDLRTPLTRLRNRLEEARHRDDDARSRALDAALIETDQLLQAFGALLRLARIEAQPAVADEPLLDLAELVDDAAELYTPSALERGLELEAHAVPCRVRGDRDQLFQVIVNLLDNALKYAPEGSRVRIQLSCHAGSAQLSVEDEGPGVPEAERERVFDRFQRLEAHRGSPGIGLGLSLVRAIVLRHGGQVRLVDCAPGLGVCINLPLAD